MRRARGQATVELALGVLVLTPLVMFGLYLLEVANEKVVVTGVATEALWESTAWSHHSYPAASFHTPSATAAAQVSVQSRFIPKKRVFVAEQGVQVTCAGSGQGVSYGISSTDSFYKDLGGARCSANLRVAAQGLPSAFLDQGSGGLFEEPASRIRRAFNLCETDRCQGFLMLMDDWGLTADNDESRECELSIGASGCQNKGFFRAGRTVYEAHRTGAGTRSRDDFNFVLGIVGQTPADLIHTKDYQMSFRGEESDFTEKVPVSEGLNQWATTPFSGPSQRSYALRKDDFLGR